VGTVPSAIVDKFRDEIGNPVSGTRDWTEFKIVIVESI
jgi:hypothetical protein